MVPSTSELAGSAYLRLLDPQWLVLVQPRRPLFHHFLMQRDPPERIHMASMGPKCKQGHQSRRCKRMHQSNRLFISHSVLQRRPSRTILMRLLNPLLSLNINQQLRCIALQATIIIPKRLRSFPILRIKGLPWYRPHLLVALRQRERPAHPQLPLLPSVAKMVDGMMLLL